MSQPIDKASASEHAETPGQVELLAMPASGNELAGPNIGSGVTRVPLSALHQRMVAVHCRILGREETLLGRGVYEQDPDLGPVLRIDGPQCEDFQLTFAEKSWNGEIAAGAGPGWEFLIRLGI